MDMTSPCGALVETPFLKFRLCSQANPRAGAILGVDGDAVTACRDFAV